jgi:DNA polymerase-1
VISTGDKDLAQLVDENVTLINTMSNEKLDVAGVSAKFGVPPERIVDYLALIGDSVDNIPGVDKVGPKTAAKWIAEHGSLEGVIAAAASIKGVVGDNLRKALDWLPQGRRLVTVATDCDLTGHVLGWPEFEGLALGPIDVPALLAFYDRYGFASMRKELEAATGKTGGAAASRVRAAPAAIDVPDSVPSEPIVTDYRTLTTLEALDDYLRRVEAAPLVAVSIETDSPDPIRANLVGCRWPTRPARRPTCRFATTTPAPRTRVPFEAALARLRPWLENADAIKVSQNVKAASHVFARLGIAVQGWRHDTMLESYVFEAHKAHSLESLAFRHLGRTALTYEEVCGKGASQIPFAQVSIERATAYSAQEADLALHVHQALAPQVEAEPGLRRCTGGSRCRPRRCWRGSSGPAC